MDTYTQAKVGHYFQKRAIEIAIQINEDYQIKLSKTQLRAFEHQALSMYKNITFQKGLTDVESTVTYYTTSLSE